MMIILMVVRDTCIINMIITRYFFEGVWATQGYEQGDETFICPDLKIDASIKSSIYQFWNVLLMANRTVSLATMFHIDCSMFAPVLDFCYKLVTQVPLLVHTLVATKFIEYDVCLSS